MAFHFLDGVIHKAQSVGKTVGHDVIAVDKAILSPFSFLAPKQGQGTPTLHPGQQIQDFKSRAQTAGREAVSFGAPVGSEIYNRVVAPVFHLPQQTFNTKSLGLGDENVPSITQAYQQTHQSHGAPLSFLAAGATLAGAYPGGGGSEIKALIKASTAKDATKALIKNGIDENIAKQIAPAVAKTKDPNIIKNIIDNAHKPPTLPQAPVHTTTPVGGEISAGQGSAEAINKHLQTIRDSQSTGPELQDAIKGLQQTHAVRNTEELSKQARDTVEKDYTGSLSKVLTDENPGDKTIALGEHLIVKAQKEGNIGEAVSVAETLDKNLREHGRSIQAASIISRLSPEGQLLRATRAVRKVREANPKNIERQNKTAGEIQQQLEKPIGQKEVSQTVKQLADEVSTGEKLAKNVEGAAAPPKPKKPVDTLVQELTKKVKQEYIEAKSTVRKNPLDILKETFGRADEAKTAYPEAQQILREKYADNEQMSNALDEFFGSKLDMPAANSTLNSAIRNQLKTSGDKVSQIIYKSHIEQGNTVRQTTDELVKEGFDEKSAAQLAKEVTKRLDQQIHDAKTKTLENMAKEAPERVKSTYTDKLNKLSNLGALDRSDYLHLAQAKLNIPHLTPDSAKKISELSQKLQGSPEGHEKASIVRAIANEVHSSVPLTKGQILKGIPGLMRTIVASGDLSFGGRQGLGYLTAHPIRFAREWPKQFAYFKEAFKGGDSEAFDAMMADIKNHPDYHWLEKSGTSILDPHAHLFDQHEEQFIGQEIADKIPGVRKLIDGSAYAYTGLANSLRANEFYAMLDHRRAAGMDINDDVVKQLGNLVDTSTGRGHLGSWGEKHAGALSTGLFAPRLIASRIRVFTNPVQYINADPQVRNEALRQLAGLTAFGVGALALAKQAGAEVDLDPRSSDFGKIKIGDTRFDVLGGFTQYIRLGVQLGLGQKINSTTGAQSEAGKGLAGSRLDIFTNFLENKANPAVSGVVTELKGKDISGNSVYSAKGQAGLISQRFIPLLFQDINDLKSHPDSVGGSNLGRAAAGVVGAFGVGVQTYGQQDLPVTDKQKQYLQQLQESGAPKAEINANKSFFQVLKSAPSRTTAYDRIHQAIDNGDYSKAQQLAQEYNNSVDEHIQQSGWVDKNEQYVSADLEKLYNSQKINLTPQSVKQYLKSKEGL